MISPTTVVVLPSTCFPMIDEATVVVLQGWSAAPFLPTSLLGSLYVPAVGFDQLGKRIPGPLAAAAARPATKDNGTTIVAVLRRIVRSGCRAILNSFLSVGVNLLRATSRIRC